MTVMIGEVQWRVRPPSYVDVVKGWKEQEPDNMGGGEEHLQSSSSSAPKGRGAPG